MKLNHLDLQTANVPELVAFLTQYFDFAPITRVDSPAIAILRDEDGFTLVLQRKKDASESYPEGFHIGFLVESPAEVHAKRASLAEAGVDISEVDTNGRGTMCYLRAPDDLLIEIGCRAR
jgi:catechol 2,3-dioxygenase-like lactoylglutathione lyase family enzyme